MHSEVWLMHSIFNIERDTRILKRVAHSQPYCKSQIGDYRFSILPLIRLYSVEMLCAVDGVLNDDDDDKNNNNNASQCIEINLLVKLV